MIPSQAFKQLEDALAEHYGWNNSPFVREKVALAVRGKAGRLGIPPEEYCTLAASSTSELLALVEETASNDSCFFREPAQFAFLVERIIPDLIDSLRSGEKLRIWSAVCSTGEEPYSLAIACDLAEKPPPGIEVEIFATDVRNRALLEASQARYRAASLANLAREWVERYFSLSGDGTGESYAVVPDIRRSVIFRRVNLLDKLFWKGVAGRFDLIVCSNQLAYMHPAATRQMVANLAGALKTGGCLMVGAGEESLVNSTALVRLPEAPSFFRRQQ